MSDEKRDRSFQDRGHYFVLTEVSSYKAQFNPVTKQIEPGEPLSWCKTHIVPTKCPATGKRGLQLIRFEGDEETLKSNPYAGVYLSPDEWKMVCERLLA